MEIKHVTEQLIGQQRNPGGSDDEDFACIAGDMGSILGLGRFPWRKKWLPTPVSLPGEFHEQRSLAGYRPWGCKELDTIEQLTQACKKYLETNENKIHQNYEIQQSSSKREVHSNKGLPEETITLQINNRTLHIKELEEEKRKSKVSRMKEITKIRVELNEIETKMTTEKINETKSWFFEKVDKTDKSLQGIPQKYKGS